MTESTENKRGYVCPHIKTDIDIEPLIDVSQVAKYLGSSVSYGHKLIATGRLKAISLPVFKKDGSKAERRMLRVRKNDLQDFMGSLEVINGDDK